MSFEQVAQNVLTHLKKEGEIMDRSDYPIELPPLFPETIPAVKAICHELARRHWSIPGVKVTVRVERVGDREIRRLSKLTGDDFDITFPTETSPTIRIVIAGKMLKIDSAHPYMQELSVYRGDWYRNRQEFLRKDDWYILAAIHGVDVLKYRLACDCDEPDGSLIWTLPVDESPFAEMEARHVHHDKPNGILVLTEKLCRERVEWRLLATEVYKDFEAWLTVYVLTWLRHVPVPAVQITESPTEPYPFEKRWKLFFLADFVMAKSLEKALRGDMFWKRSSGYLECKSLADTYELVQNGSWPILACGILPLEDTPQSPLELRQLYPCDLAEKLRDHYYCIEVVPDFADRIYIADYGKYIHELSLDKAADTDKSPASLDSLARKAMLSCMVPLDLYRGGYQIPIAYLNRDIKVSEVYRVSERHAEYIDRILEMGPEAQEILESAIYALSKGSDGFLGALRLRIAYSALRRAIQKDKQLLKSLKSLNLREVGEKPKSRVSDAVLYSIANAAREARSLEILKLGQALGR